MNPELVVPFHRPSIGQEEMNEVTAVLQSGWLTTGPRTARFEEEFRSYVQTPHALAVNSCTSGMHLALAALGVGPGAEVITTPLTFCATVNVILQVGATPVLADIGDDGNIDVASIAARITRRTRAIMPVHIAGLPCHMQPIWELARRLRLFVIEDCAHAVGSHYQGWPIGAGDPERGYYSDAAAFSFYATKNLTTGEGGMVTTHDDRLATAMKGLCLHGITRDAWNRYSDKGNWYYEVMSAGFKYNLSDLQSAVGIHQLRKLESFIAVRKRYSDILGELMGDCDEVELPPDRHDSRHSWHLYMLRLNLDRLSIDRDEFILALRERGIAVSVHFIPIPLHPFFALYAGREENQCPRALELYKRLISLPIYPAMTEQQVRYVAEAVLSVARNAKKRQAVMTVGGQ